MKEQKVDGIRIISYILAVLFILSIFAKFFIDEPAPEAVDSETHIQEVSPTESSSLK